VLSPSSTSPFSAPEILAHETHAKGTTNDQMTNDESNLNDESRKLNVLVQLFVNRISTFLRHSPFVLRHFYP